MKKYFKILLVNFFIIVIKLNAQEWVKVNPIFYPPGNYKTYIGSFANKNDGWWVELFPGTIWKTTDEGVTWNKQFDSIQAGYSDVKFIDSLHGWMTGLTITPDEYFLLTTKDGGKYWNKYSTPVIKCLSFFDSLNGFAGGDSIYATLDGGITWQPQTIEIGVQFGINKIFFIDNKNGWAVGYSVRYSDAGIILNTTDGGKYWKINEHPSGVSARAVYFTDSLHGYVVGSNPPYFEGVIKVTNDGGASWITHYLPSSFLNDVVFTDDSTGWVIGDYGFIWHTTDKGINWNKVESGTTSHLYRIFFFENGKYGYILGVDSTLLKYDKTVGIKEEHSYKELLFELSQSYPNPFNSQTGIDFIIPKRDFVIVEVHDVLGRKLKTLMCKFLESGKHSIIFDASGMPSGVYYYSLITTSRRITKKMLLIQ